MCLLIAWYSFVSNVAQAQRGGSYELYQPSGRPGPTRGYPGFFDTEQPEQGTLTAELFTFAFDYGINERWSLGTNGLAMVGLPLVGVNALFVKSRYRVLETDKLVSAVTAYGGFGFQSSISGGFGYLGMLTINTAYALSKGQDLGVSLGVLRAGVQSRQPGDPDYLSLKGTAGYAGLIYHLILNPTLQVEALVVPLFAGSLEADLTQASLSVDGMPGFSDGISLYGRFAADMLLSDGFLLTPMLIVVGQTNTGFGASPALNLMFRFGGD